MALYDIIKVHAFDAAIPYYVLFKGPILSHFPNPHSSCTAISRLLSVVPTVLES